MTTPAAQTSPAAMRSIAALRGLVVDAIAARWSSLAKREQVIVASGAALLALALFITFIWLPLQRGRADLAMRLPDLRARLAVMQAQADEIRRVRALPPAAVVAARTLDAQTLRETFTGNQIVVTPLDERRFRVVIASTRHAAWIDELNRLQAATGAHVDEAVLTALTPGSGNVRVEATLAPAPVAR